MTLTQKIGDVAIYRIPMRRGKSTFTGGEGWSYLYTLKANPDDLDAASLIQKTDGAGITISGDDALLRLLHVDTAGGVDENDAVIPAIDPGTYYWDIQAALTVNGEVADVCTVASGTQVLLRDIGRSTAPSVTIYTAEPPTTIGLAAAITAASTITPITGDEIAPALSGGVLGKITYTAIKTWVLSGLQIAWGSVTGKPTTLVGYGITDAEPAKGADDNYVTDAQKAALHAAATVAGNGIAITGQQISLSIGTGSTQVAAGNHSHALLDSATDAATADTLAKRGSVGQVSFAGDATATALSAANSGIGKGAEISSAGGHGAGISSGSGTGAIISTSTGQFGADIYNYGSGTGAYIGSYSGTGAEISSGSGTYHATFGLSGNARAFVARLLGAFGWWRGAYTLMVSAVDTLTANRVQRFPDKDGTIALTSDLSGLADTSANLSDLASASAARTNLGLGTLATQSGTFSGTSSGTNTGDQTTIAGITGTVAQFNTALTDGDFATLAGTEVITNKTLTNPAINNYVEGVVAIGNSGTSQTIALTAGTVQTCTLTGNCTFTMPTATAGKSFVLYLNTGAGSLTGTFTGVKWAGGTAPTITATASRMDILSFVADGTNWYGSAIQNYTP